MRTKNKRLIIYMLAVAVLLGFSLSPLVAGAASAATKTVKTQKQLNAALKNSKVKTIIIKTSDSKTFRVSKKNYKTKKIILKAENATLQSKGKFYSIKVASGRKLMQRGSARMISAEAEDLNVVLDAGSHTDSLIVSGNDSDVSVNDNASVEDVSVDGDDATLHIDEGSRVEQIEVTGDHARIQDDESTSIEADEGIVAIIDESAADTNVALSSDGVYSSVINRTDETVDLKVEQEKIGLSAGEVYSMTDSAADVPSPLHEGNPFRKFDSMVKCGNICLEIHGAGSFSYLSSDERIHGWYHNLATGTDYECFFMINGSEIYAERVENTGFEKNYLGDAAFRITGQDEESVTLTSVNDVYGDNGAEYSLVYPTSGYQQVPGEDAVSDDNPFRIFRSETNTSNGLWLEIHGTGVFANMSSGNRIHGWYHNTNTGTDYECRFVFDGNSITVEHIENTGYEKNFMGETSFEVVSSDSDSVTLQSTSGVYGDEGTQYTFFVEKQGSDGGELEGVNPDNPFAIFTSGTETIEGVRLEIHGKDKISHGDRIHGWYHNANTDTDYECWFEFDGTSVVARRNENKTYERNYLGDATFEITAFDNNSVTLKSSSDIYGDKGTVYTFHAGN